MKKVFLSTLYVLILISLFSSVFSASGREFDFEINIENEFSEEEEIECDLDIDDKKTDFNLNEGDETHRERDDFEEDIELDCNKSLDKIIVIVEDSEGLIIYQKIFLNSFGFKYKANPVDTSKQYFKIDVSDHDFDLTGNIDCDLEIDSKYDYEYDFDDDTDNEDLIIERNFDEKIKFDCDEQFEEIEFLVFDNQGNEVFKEKYKKENNFEYDSRGLNKNYFEIEITHEIGNDTIDCNLRIDDDETEEYTFDEDSEKDDFDIEKNFIEKIEFDCDSELELIELTVYDSNFKLIDVIEYEDEDKFEYEFNQGDYEFFLEIKHNFNNDDEIDCDLDIDDDDRISFEYTDSSSLSDLRIEDAFEEEFQFDCNENLDSLYLLVFEDEESGKDIQIFEKTYQNTDRINFNINDVPKKSNIEIIDNSNQEKENDVNEENNNQVDSKNIEIDESRMPILVNKNENANTINSSISNNIKEDENIKEEIKNNNDITLYVVGAGVGILVILGLVLLIVLI